MFARSSTGMPYWAYATTFPGKGNAQYSFLETSNRVHLRDIPVLDRMDSSISRLLPGPITIMSAQMGMVPYFLSMKYFGKVSYIDIRALTTRHFTQCSLSSALPRGRGGLGMTYDYFFRHSTEFAQSCHVPPPDIIYDLDYRDGAIEDLKKAGYRIVYMQVGKIQSGSRWFPGADIPSDQFIAIRGDLVGENKETQDTLPWEKVFSDTFGKPAKPMN